MESPEPVSRVRPPRSTITRTMKARIRSQKLLQRGGHYPVYLLLISYIYLEFLHNSHYRCGHSPNRIYRNAHRGSPQGIAHWGLASLIIEDSNGRFHGRAEARFFRHIR